jgi:hypothetical protein
VAGALEAADGAVADVVAPGDIDQGLASVTPRKSFSPACDRQSLVANNILGDEGSARPFQHARTLHDVAIVPLAMASARWASPTPDNSLSRHHWVCHCAEKPLRVKNCCGRRFADMPRLLP